MAKISYAGCDGSSPKISAQFSLEMCIAACLRKKIHQNPLFLGSRSFNVIDVDIPTKPVASACCDKQHVCAYLKAFLR